MRKIETYIITARIGKNFYDREDMEKIEGMTFASIDDAKKYLMSINPLADHKSVFFSRIWEFMTDWNDTDSESKSLYSNYSPSKTWASYVYIEK